MEVDVQFCTDCRIGPSWASRPIDTRWTQWLWLMFQSYGGWVCQRKWARVCVNVWSRLTTIVVVTLRTSQWQLTLDGNTPLLQWFDRILSNRWWGYIIYIYSETIVCVSIFTYRTICLFYYGYYQKCKWCVCAAAFNRRMEWNGKHRPVDIRATQKYAYKYKRNTKARKHAIGIRSQQSGITSYRLLKPPTTPAATLAFTFDPSLSPSC